jgi:hypothetical protein
LVLIGNKEMRGKGAVFGFAGAACADVLDIHY